MSYLLAQILVCLLIAGLIGAIIGWLLRGGCSKRLQECEDEWKIKVSSLESEYNSKINDDKLDLSSKAYHSHSNDHDLGHATLKKEMPSVTSEDIDNDSKAGIIATTVATSAAALSSIGDDSNDNLDNVKSIISQNGINLSENKISLYKENGVDFENTNHLEESYDIQAIEGIGPKYAQELKELGVHTTDDLITTLHKNQQDILRFANKLDTKPETILSWISMADIMKLPGVNGQIAELLHTVGISSIAELAVTNPNSLHNEMITFNKKSPIIPEVPTLNSVTMWTNIAKYI